MGNTVGIHEVIISTAYETLTLRHEAHDRALYAEGALTAAEFIIGKKPGLYDMSDIFG
jgi:4-hydroxy-tetrahydrodipicolinate reductase